MKACLFVCVFLGGCTCYFNVEAVEATGVLYDELFGTSLEDHFKVSSEYRADVLPVAEWGSPVTVFAGFNLVSFAGLDVDTGILRLTAWLRLKWTDRRLLFNGLERFGASWNPALDHVPVPAGKLWTPDVVHLRSAEEYSQQVTEQLAYLYDSDFFNATGNKYNIFWSRPVILSQHCKIKLEYFPFDQQDCHFTFMAWGHSTRQVLLRPFSEAGESIISRDEMFGDEDTQESVFSYKVTKVIVSAPEVEEYSTMTSQFSALTLTILLERQSHHVVTHVICPVILLVVLSTLTLWLPERQGERVSYAVTVLFTLLAIITFSSDLRPHSGVSTWLDTFQSTCIVLSTLPLVQTVFFVSSLEKIDERDDFYFFDDDATPFPRGKSFKDFVTCCCKSNSPVKWLACQRIDLFLRLLHPLLVFISFGVLFGALTPPNFEMYKHMFGKAPHQIHNYILLIVFVLLFPMGMRWFVFGNSAETRPQEPIRSQEQSRDILTLKQTPSSQSKPDHNEPSRDILTPKQIPSSQAKPDQIVPQEEETAKSMKEEKAAWQ